MLWGAFLFQMVHNHTRMYSYKSNTCQSDFWFGRLMYISKIPQTEKKFCYLQDFAYKRVLKIQDTKCTTQETRTIVVSKTKNTLGSDTYMYIICFSHLLSSMLFFSFLGRPRHSNHRCN